MENKKKIYLNGEESQYYIYDDGRCYSLHSKHFLKPKTSTGYVRYSLSLKGKIYDRYAHRLVAEAFIDRGRDQNEVNHKDGNIRNNDYRNLEWVTRQENLRHQFENQLYGGKKILQYTLDGVYIKSWNSSTEASRELNLSSSGINNCCNNTQINSGGYQWCYEDNTSSIKILGYDAKIRFQEIEMYDKNWNLIRTFDKVSDIYPYFGKTDNGYISQVLKGKRKSAWGYYFKYKHI